MRRLSILLLVLSLPLSLACSSDPEPRPEPTPQAEDPAPPEPETPAEPDEPEGPPPLPEARTVRIEAEDGVVLVGDLRVGASPEAPLVVLVHQLSSTRAEWEPLLRHLAADPALSTFALDMRGHGESDAKADGTEVSWQDFDTEEWERVASDVRRVIAHLREEEGLSPSKVALVGSSIGSSAVILAAAEEQGVDAVVALSPGRAYRGVDALTPLTALGDRPLLVVAARGEAPSAETAADMERIAAGGEAVMVDGDQHGVAMFEASPQSLERVVAFLREHLSGGA